MKTIRKTIEELSHQARPVGRVDVGRLDANGEAEIDRQMAEDVAHALRVNAHQEPPLFAHEVAVFTSSVLTAV